MLATLLTVATLGAARADWPSDPGVNVPVSTAANSQDRPAIVSDGAGGAIVVWQDTRSGRSNIYAQRVGAAGVPLWPSGGVALCTAAGSQLLPCIASDGAGGAIIAWYDSRTWPSFDVYAQRVNALGVPLWTKDGVPLCTAAESQSNPDIVADGAGGAIVVWSDGRAGESDIYAQRVTGSGVPQWTADGVALTVIAGNQGMPRITSDDAGGAIITWLDFREGLGPGYRVFTQRVDGAGIPQWTDQGVGLCSPTGVVLLLESNHLQIAADETGGAIVVWRDRRDGNMDLYAQRVNAAGTVHWSAGGNAVCNELGDQGAPRIAATGGGEAVICWRDPRAGATDIYAQRLNAAGVALWPTNGTAVCSAAGNQAEPSIQPDGAGGVLVTWQDGRAGGHNDIYAQRVDATGAPQWLADGVALCTSAFDQTQPAIVTDGAGGAIVAWKDLRGLDPDIYAQNVRADGTLGGTTLSAPPSSGTAGFALRSIHPNPARGALRVAFSLFDDSPAALELHDLSGRRLVSNRIALGRGDHTVALETRAGLAPGIYWVSLTQGARTEHRKAVVYR